MLLIKNPPRSCTCLLLWIPFFLASCSVAPKPQALPTVVEPERPTLETPQALLEKLRELRSRSFRLVGLYPPYRTVRTLRNPGSPGYYPESENQYRHQMLGFSQQLSRELVEYLTERRLSVTGMSTRELEGLSFNPEFGPLLAASDDNSPVVLLELEPEYRRVSSPFRGRDRIEEHTRVQISLLRYPYPGVVLSRAHHWSTHVDLPRARQDAPPVPEDYPYLYAYPYPFQYRHDRRQHGAIPFVYRRHAAFARPHRMFYSY